LRKDIARVYGVVRELRVVQTEEQRVAFGSGERGIEGWVMIRSCRDGVGTHFWSGERGIEGWVMIRSGRDGVGTHFWSGENWEGSIGLSHSSRSKMGDSGKTSSS
jgi:hypothetical protein